MTQKIAFVLMPFLDKFSDVYTYLISESLQNSGYTVKRADDIKSQNNIIGDIIESIMISDLVVADLTGANPNVYYELGIAHALDKKVILMTQEIEELPFDLRPYRVIGYGVHFAKMNQAKKELSDLALEAFNGTLPFGNPVKDFGNIKKKLSETTDNDFKSDKFETSLEDFGILDYQIMLEDGFESLGAMVAEVGKELNTGVTKKIKESVGKLNSDKYNTKQKRNIIQELAKHLQDYGAFMQPKNVKYKELLRGVGTSLENMFSGGRFEIENEGAEKELQNFLNALSGVETSAFEGRQSFAGLIETMESLPKIEKNFNRANTFMATELKTFVDNIDQTISIIERAGRLGTSLIGKLHNKTIESKF